MFPVKFLTIPSLLESRLVTATSLILNCIFGNDDWKVCFIFLLVKIKCNSKDQTTDTPYQFETKAWDHGSV